MTDPGKEIELKLLLPQGTKSLLAHPRLSGVTQTRQRLHTIYFDTRDFKLAKRGVALRVRRAGRRWIQTLKTEGNSSGGLSTRVELEVPVSGPAIEFKHFPPDAHDYLPRSVLNKLIPVFETRFTRRSWEVTGIHGSRIEVALDEGEIIAGNTSEPIRELELELKGGRPDALFALALDLGKTVTLWPFDRSKAERGAGLATGKSTAPMKTVQPRLDRNMSLAEAWRAIAHPCLRQFSANLPGIGYESDPEYLHQARVALRRFRSAYGLFRKPCPLPQKLLLELERLNRVLGSARDQDVFCIETLPAIRESLSDPAPLDYLERLAEVARRGAHDELARYLQSPAFGRLLIGLARHLTPSRIHAAFNPPEQGLEKFAAAKLGKRHKRTIAMITKQGKTPEERHQLRIRIKHLRYAVDCFSALLPGRDVASLTSALADLQTCLGKLNDQVVAGRLMTSMDDDTAAFQRASDLVKGWQAANGLALIRLLGYGLQNFPIASRIWYNSPIYLGGL
jgi:inorganic triphosphatase YgiF